MKLYNSNLNNFLRILTLSFFVGYVFCSYAGGIIGEDDQYNNYYFVFDSDFTKNKKTFEGITLGTEFNNFDRNITSAGVRIKGYVLCNNVPNNEGKYDIGFYFLGESSSTTLPKSNDMVANLMITDYAEGKEKSIQSVEIKWSFDSPNGGYIGLHGRNTMPYEQSFDLSYNDYAEDDEIDMILRPSTDNNNVSVYNLPKDVKYIALCYYPNDTEDLSNAKIARFEYLKVHFVDEWVDPNPEPEATVQVHLGDEGGNYDLEWRNDADKMRVPLETIYSAWEKQEDETYFYDPSQLNLTFWLTPNFEPSDNFPKEPTVDSTDESNKFKPEVFNWNLYNIFEANKDNHPYDGFISSKEPIECPLVDGQYLEIPAPCSGEYILSVTQSGEDAPKIKSNEATLNIWPSVKNDYSWLKETEMAWSTLYSFSLNWVNFPEEIENGIISYPYELLEENQQSTATIAGTKNAYMHDVPATIYIPGLFDATIEYRIDFDGGGAGSGFVGNLNSKTRRAAEDADGFKSYDSEPFTLDDLTSSATLQLRISKNGAVTPSDTAGTSLSTLRINLSDTKQTPVGVKAVTVTPGEGEEEYYDLNGLRVNPATAAPGIYIRRQGGETRKVVITA